MRLKTYLRLNGLTQKQFAENVGSTYWAVRKWCYGERMPRPAQLRKINSATNGQVTANDFMR